MSTSSTGKPMRRPAFSSTRTSDGVAHLDGVAADLVEAVARKIAPRAVARRSVERVRPHAVAANVAQVAARHAEIRGAFFQQNAAGRVVPPGRVARSAVGDLHAVDRQPRARGWPARRSRRCCGSARSRMTSRATPSASTPLPRVKRANGTFEGGSPARISSASRLPSIVKSRSATPSPRTTQRRGPAKSGGHAQHGPAGAPRSFGAGRDGHRAVHFHRAGRKLDDAPRGPAASAASSAARQTTPPRRRPRASAPPRWPAGRTRGGPARYAPRAGRRPMPAGSRKLNSQRRSTGSAQNSSISRARQAVHRGAEPAASATSSSVTFTMPRDDAAAREQVDPIA